MTVFEEWLAYLEFQNCTRLRNGRVEVERKAQCLIMKLEKIQQFQAHDSNAVIYIEAYISVTSGHLLVLTGVRLLISPCTSPTNAAWT